MYPNTKYEKPRIIPINQTNPPLPTEAQSLPPKVIGISDNARDTLDKGKLIVQDGY